MGSPQIMRKLWTLMRFATAEAPAKNSAHLKLAPVSPIAIPTPPVETPHAVPETVSETGRVDGGF